MALHRLDARPEHQTAPSGRVARLTLRLVIVALTLASVAVYIARTRDDDLAGSQVERYCRYLVFSQLQLDHCVENINDDFVVRARNQAAEYAMGIDTRCLADAGPLCVE